MTLFLKLHAIEKGEETPRAIHVNMRLVQSFEATTDETTIITYCEGNEIEVAEDAETIASWISHSRTAECLEAGDE